MSTYYTGVTGYGVNIDDLKLKAPMNNEKFANGVILDDVINDQAICYELNCERGNYILVYDQHPWKTNSNDPKSEEECKERIWKTLERYVDMTETEVKALCDNISDCYYG